ncbi:MmcQ/YjbR family DNA-binding protein [Streptomyces sp. AM8-1-1]|uniref:MmcQ/YjbR family DNA-binding protein n=1 Tax=Streptomyces sp. AM8-1-1 TaxID=3075825 RepID=UPI0028C4237D|nr:MmcQ/YjbR family DNA-binding protein [Streptomyces sp. AM8-1-1]WNO76624.1 MmcQ/YjbR family DNA-binding protein [Streptomyces sp. AM8-1-1]
MTTRAQLRRTALSLPETAEQATRSGSVSFSVRDKPFASVDKDKRVQLHLPSEEADEVLAAHPAAVRATRGASSVGVRVALEDMDGQQLNHWVRRAWLWRAPKRLAAQMAAADAATAGGVGDLPKSIGRPATSALLSAGITSLDQVAERTEAELLAMHGVGPKAVRLLGEALGSTGRRLRG